MIQIANDATCCPHPWLTQLDEQGIAERYDIVIDSTVTHRAESTWCLAEHQDGKRVADDSPSPKRCRQFAGPFVTVPGVSRLRIRLRDQSQGPVMIPNRICRTSGGAAADVRVGRFGVKLVEASRASFRVELDHDRIVVADHGRKSLSRDLCGLRDTFQQTVRGRAQECLLVRDISSGAFADRDRQVCGYSRISTMTRDLGGISSAHELKRRPSRR